MTGNSSNLRGLREGSGDCVLSVVVVKVVVVVEVVKVGERRVSGRRGYRPSWLRPPCSMSRARDPQGNARFQS